MQVLGVDLGSSFIKGGVLDLDTLRPVRIVRTPFPEPRAGLPAGHFEVDPAAIVAAAERTIETLLADAPGCGGILFCSQMGGVVLTDRQGAPLSNYLSWRDERTVVADEAGESVSERINRALAGRTFDELGRELKAGSMLLLLAWLRERRALPENAVPLGLGEFVVSRMCRSSPATEPTAALGGLHLGQGTWHGEAQQAAVLGGLGWPRIAPFHEPVGQYFHRGGRIPCYPAVGDHQAALTGALLEEGELSINISTGSQVSRLARDWRPGEYQTRSCFDGRFLNTITHLPAGRSLEVLIDLLTELPRRAGHVVPDAWELASAAAEAAADSDLAVDLSFFAGPLGERGAVRNISTGNLTVGTLFRGAFQCMARNYEQCARRIFPAGGWSRIAFSGGLARKNRLLRELVAERLRGECRVAPFAEDTLMGLMVLALVATGRAQSVAEATEQVARSAAGESSSDHTD